MKKLSLTALIILLFVVFISSPVMATEDQELKKETNQIVDEILNNVDTYELENVIGDAKGNVDNYIPNLNIREMISSISKGEFKFSIKEFFLGVGRFLFEEVLNSSGLLARLILLSILSAILQNIQSSFEDNGVGDIAFSVIYLVIIGIAIQSFASAVQIGREAIESMVTFMQALLPTLLILLASMGSLASAALFQPLITITITMISTFIKNIILPMTFLAAVLNLVTYLNNKMQISKLASLIKQSTVVLLGFSLTVFIGVMTIQGISGASFDGVTVRTAKYAVDNMLPIVGGFLSDAVDTIIGCSLLIKNAVGVVGLIFLFILMLFPIVKIIALILIYKISSALIEPIADNRIVSCLNDISKSLILILASVISVAIMFFIMITIIVGAGNITVMMR